MGENVRRMAENPHRALKGKLSTPLILQAALDIIKSRRPNLTGRHLDIGSGTGELIELMQKEFKVTSTACDYTDQLMQIPGQKVDVVDLNTEALPYPDATFDLVTMTEVVEHIEHHHRTMREIYRILKPGGLVVLSTPNILNVKSRLRFMWFGYWNLFGPLHVKDSARHCTGGHINPISSFYLSHALLDAGFKNVTLTVDKVQNSSLIPLVFLWLPIRFFGWLAWRKEVRRYQTIDEHNVELVRAMNSTPVLLGRTVVAGVEK